MKHRKTLLATAIVLTMTLFVSVPLALASGTSYIPCECSREPCICFIREGDEGRAVKVVIELLIGKDYLDPKTKIGQFNADVTQAVLRFQRDNKLPATGTMDDDTLTLLIWDMLPEKLDKAMPTERGKPETCPDMVYIPTDGGKKRHSKPECSKMYDPRKVSIRNAAKLGFDACKRCETDRERLLH